MKHSFILLMTLNIFLAAPLRAATENLSLEQLLKEASERNPDVQSAFRAWHVAEKEADTAGLWSSPTLKYIREKDPSGMEGVAPLERRHYSVEQEIPFPGKLHSESRMMHHEALIKEAAYREKQLEAQKEA